MKDTLLYIGDAACSSGFGRAWHSIQKTLRNTWSLAALGVNHNGDSTGYDGYPLYPAWPGGDPLGVGRLPDIVTQTNPSMIVLQTNPWNVPVYLKTLKNYKQDHIPVVGIIAVEGKNCVGRHLNGLHRAIFWTEFAKREAIQGGFTRPSDVIPLGVDTSLYSPGDRQEARALLQMPQVPDGSFIVCNVNRNQARKRIDLSVMYFAEWIRTRNVRDAYLYLHLLPGSTAKINCEQLAEYCGIGNRLILAEPKDVFQGAPEDYVVAAYRASDVGLTTTLAEGMGLTTLEAAACGNPQIAGDYSALGEWGKDALYLVPCPEEGVMPDVNGMIGAPPDRQSVIDALDLFYRDPDARAVWGAKALSRAGEQRFNWACIGKRIGESIETARVACHQ